MPAIPDGIVTHKFARHTQNIAPSAFLHPMHQSVSHRRMCYARGPCEVVNTMMGIAKYELFGKQKNSIHGSVYTIIDCAVELLYK